MYEKFEALDKEKQLRIINSAFDEFALKQFGKASTDKIAKNAQISKGALFQYFGTKKKLYFYIYKYAYKVVAKEFWGQIDLSSTDIFERIRSAMDVKLKIYCKHPNVFEFIINSNLRETDQDIKAFMSEEEILQKNNAYAKILADIDYSKFKEEYDPKHIIAIIFWVMDGFGHQVTSRLNNEQFSIDIYECWANEFDEYIEVLKKAYYKEVN
ncbi:MAG: TetR/AcrR family transcriptional regulator [Eubacteriales bacterium]